MRRKKTIRMVWKFREGMVTCETITEGIMEGSGPLDAEGWAEGPQNPRGTTEVSHWDLWALWGSLVHNLGPPSSLGKGSAWDAETLGAVPKPTGRSRLSPSLWLSVLSSRCQEHSLGDRTPDEPQHEWHQLHPCCPGMASSWCSHPTGLAHPGTCGSPGQ